MSRRTRVSRDPTMLEHSNDGLLEHSIRLARRFNYSHYPYYSHRFCELGFHTLSLIEQLYRNSQKIKNQDFFELSSPKCACVRDTVCVRVCRFECSCVCVFACYTRKFAYPPCNLLGSCVLLSALSRNWVTPSL